VRRRVDRDELDVVVESRRAKGRCDELTTMNPQDLKLCRKAYDIIKDGTLLDGFDDIDADEREERLAGAERVLSSPRLSEELLRVAREDAAGPGCPFWLREKMENDLVNERPDMVAHIASARGMATVLNYMTKPVKKEKTERAVKLLRLYGNLDKGGLTLDDWEDRYGQIPIGLSNRCAELAQKLERRLART
jgi:hypothetical protein